jgi:hypothetical protein
MAGSGKRDHLILNLQTLAHKTLPWSIAISFVGLAQASGLERAV